MTCFILYGMTLVLRQHSWFFLRYFSISQSIDRRHCAALSSLHAHARTPPMIHHTPENKWQVVPLVHLKFKFSLIHYKWGSVKTFLRKGIIPKYLHIVEHSTLDRIRYKRCSMFHIRSEQKLIGLNSSERSNLGISIYLIFIYSGFH